MENDPTPQRGRSKSWIVPILAAALLILGVIALSKGFSGVPFMYRNL